MNLQNTLIPLLRCPETGETISLTSEGDALTSTQSGINYPVMRGIPWLNPHPLHSMVDWSIKLNHFHTILNEEIQVLSSELNHAENETKQRLSLLLQGKQDFLSQVTDLVSVITQTKVASKPLYDALSDRAPNTQNLLSYEANLYRDWVWGEEENQLSVGLVSDKVNTDKIDNMLVIGAGACRLAYDLHHELTPGNTIANDINPLLLFSAEQILFGDGLTINEFPMQPRSSDYVSLTHKIAAKQNPGDNFHLLFSDAVKPALQAGCCDLVITPWVIDIQPFELSEFLSAINHYLPIGGSWINFGSLVFNQDRDAYCYAIEEVNAIAESTGFRIEEISEHEIPYLKSPYNAGWRMENIWCWRAVKIADVSMTDDLQHLPNWILDPTVPIPANSEINNFAFSHQTYADIAAYIDGNHSIERIGRKFARKNKMDEQEATAMIKNFYLKMLNLQ